MASNPSPHDQADPLPAGTMAAPEGAGEELLDDKNSQMPRKSWIFVAPLRWATASLRHFGGVWGKLLSVRGRWALPSRWAWFVLGGVGCLALAGGIWTAYRGSSSPVAITPPTVEAPTTTNVSAHATSQAGGPISARENTVNPGMSGESPPMAPLRMASWEPNRSDRKESDGSPARVIPSPSEGPETVGAEESSNPLRPSGEYRWNLARVQSSFPSGGQPASSMAIRPANIGTSGTGSTDAGTFEQAGEPMSPTGISHPPWGPPSVHAQRPDAEEDPFMPPILGSGMSAENSTLSAQSPTSEANQPGIAREDFSSPGFAGSGSPLGTSDGSPFSSPAQNFSPEPNSSSWSSGIEPGLLPLEQPPSLARSEESLNATPGPPGASQPDTQGELIQKRGNIAALGSQRGSFPRGQSELPSDTTPDFSLGSSPQDPTVLGPSAQTSPSAGGTETQPAHAGHPQLTNGSAGSPDTSAELGVPSELWEQSSVPASRDTTSGGLGDNQQSRTLNHGEQPLFSGSGTPEATGVPGDPRLEGPQSPRLNVEKVAPEELLVGKPGVIYIRVTNSGDMPAHQVEIRDAVPRGTKLVATRPQASVMPDGRLVWRVGTLPPGQEVSIEMEILPLQEGEVGSVAEVVFATAAGARSRVTKPELELRVLAPETVLIGSPANLTLKISNPGSGPAAQVVVEAYLPRGLTHPAGSAIMYEVGPLAPGESRELTLSLQTQEPGKHSCRLVARGEPNLRVATEVPLEVTSPLLELTLSGSRRRFLDRQAVFELAVTNRGTAPARDVRLAVTLPPGVDFVSANNQGIFDGSTRRVRWQLEELPVGETGTVRFVLLPRQAGKFQLEAVAEAERSTPAQDSLGIDVEGIAALQFQVHDLTDPVALGAETVYEIRVANQGSKEAKEVRVAVTTPPGLRITQAEAPVRYYTEAGRIIFDPLPDLPPKSEVIFRVTAQAVRPGDQRIRVEVTSDELRTPIVKEESTNVFAEE